MGVAAMNDEFSQLIEFDVVQPDLENGRIIEASAGSGKTFSVAGMVAHEIAMNSDLRISEILVTTFTRNSAAELRDRIRRRLVSLEESLRSGVADDKDALAQSLIVGDRLTMADRLMRAIREFDSATIATIHSICSRVMAMAGLSVSGEGKANSEIEQLISGVINDEVVAAVRESKVEDLETNKGKTFLNLDIKQYVGRLTQVVKEALGSPLSKLAIDGDVNDVDDAGSDGLAYQTRLIVNRCVNRIRQLTKDDPTFDDLLFRTAQLLGPNGDAAATRAFREGFSLDIID
jgi:exodeoxyribonuclease V beta subunit